VGFGRFKEFKGRAFVKVDLKVFAAGDYFEGSLRTELAA
jgi:hypothetical protein